jgi:hypothetical protein
MGVRPDAPTNETIVWMTEKGLFKLFTNSFGSIFPISLKPLLSAIFCRSGSKGYSPLRGWHEAGKGRGWADKKAITPIIQETFPWPIPTKKILALTT